MWKGAHFHLANSGRALQSPQRVTAVRTNFHCTGRELFSDRAKNRVRSVYCLNFLIIVFVTQRTVAHRTSVVKILRGLHLELYYMLGPLSRNFCKYVASW